MDSGSSGLSGGAIAGIIIGVLVLLTLIGIAVFLHRRHAQKKTLSLPESKSDNPPSYVQLPATEHETKAEMYVDPRDVTEMRGQGKFPAELESKNGGKTIPGVHEIEGDSGLVPVGNRREHKMEVLSPVSPLDGTDASVSGVAGSTGATQSGGESARGRLLQ